MKILCTIGFVLMETMCFGQFRNAPTPDQYFSSILYPVNTVPQKAFFKRFTPDPIQNVKQNSPSLTNLAYSDMRSPNNFFWTGTVTTMSYNKGRFGTLYYWDVQGNLRGTRGFIDLSGKEKRGFKLVFPWKMFR